MTMREGRIDIANRLRETASDLVELVTGQLKLMRLELLADARAMGARLGRLAICAAVALIGYACLIAALVMALAARLGLAGALVIVGASQILAAAWGITATVQGARRLRRNLELATEK